MFEHKKHSEVFKRWYVAVVILTVIAGVVAGFVFKTGGEVEVSSLYSIDVTEEKFNWALMFAIWVSCVPLAAVLYAVYSHLENQEVTINILNSIRINSVSNATVESNKAAPTAPISNFAAMDSGNETWRCPKCGTTNLMKNSECKNCGYEDRGI